MRDLDQQPRIDFSERPIDQVASWLDRRTRCQALVLVFGSAAVVTGLDLSAAFYDLRLATLYIVPISLACWLFSTRQAVTVTVTLIVVAFARHTWQEGSGVCLLIVNGIARALAFGLLTALVLGFRRTFDHMRITASRDRMTGALNKAEFQKRTQVLLDRASNAGRTVLLLYVDLDGFKAINDQYGHHAGDKILETFSRGAAEGLRRGDCFGRLGGDEFAIAIRMGDAQGAQQLAEKLHKRFSSALRDTGHSVTCSTGGVAILPGAGACLDDLMRKADQLMYAAKRGGKDDLRFSTVVPSLSLSSRPMLTTQLRNPSEIPGGA
ncbi:GGDEF domain-containing protein (plasmid) [Rhizobium sp. NIBRBAC000502774]|nr:GGDEF domain-containing protein [Rhizobium sp. NIBRBAC000502774]